jgi:Kef-type K+ transport system membrane component KefB/nucleotide-binding universal stress UspA family protein
MFLYTALSVEFPLKNPILIFSVILFIILFAPLILNKLRIPHLIGLIIAGAAVGPNGLHIMDRDSSIILFGTVGLQYIMFLAGLEIDLVEFKKNSVRSLVFGLLTFSIPMTLGIILGIHILHFSWPTSILLASMFASHTLIAYPIVSKFGVAKNRAVTVTVGGTMITDTLALLVLAVIAGMSTGEINNEFWIRLGVSVILFASIVIFIFPLIGRWFFKKFHDSVSQYIFVLGLVFMGAFLAEAAGIEGIIGAFLAGLSLNRLIPHTSALMNRIEFVGNALFIPFFLIGVGMLIDYRVFFKDADTIKVAISMVVVATLAKFLAAWATQKIYRFSADERRLIFGLSNAQAAATLAAVLVGYNIIVGETPEGEPIRLLSESVLNGTILMILFTCTIASFVAQKGAMNLALQEENDDVDSQLQETEERILIPINNLETTNELIDLAVTIKSKRNKDGLFALNVVEELDHNGGGERRGRKILEKAKVFASGSDNSVRELLRYDLNVVNGITNVVRENAITDLIIGLHEKKGLTESFLGHLTTGILDRSVATTFIYKAQQPLATIKRHIIMVPPGAEKELGFALWLVKVWNIARNTGAKLVFYSSESTIEVIKALQQKHPVECDFVPFPDWEDFLVLRSELKPNDNLMVVMSRRGNISYTNVMAKIPMFLTKYFESNSFTLVYPIQQIESAAGNYDLRNSSILEPLRENLGLIDEIGRNLLRVFKSKS